MPAKVDELFDEVKKSNPSYSDEQAWATAWSIYCKHVEPGSESCHMPTSEYLKGQKTAGNNPEALQIALEIERNAEALMSSGFDEKALDKIEAAWKAAKQKGLDKEVHKIIQQMSEAEMAQAIRNMGKSASERVVARFVGKTAGRDGKMVGNGWRLTWDLGSFTLEELPAKGKRKLRRAQLRNPYYWSKFDAWLPENILNFYGKVSPSDSYEAVKDKIVASMTSEKALADVRAHAKPGIDLTGFIKDIKWYENEVHYLKVVPENVEPFVAKGKDFAVSCSWTEFESYSPSSDDYGGSGDPHYTVIKSTAPASARKLYQMLKAEPNALSGMPWDKFDDFLKSNKINYEFQHSVWH